MFEVRVRNTYEVKYPSTSFIILYSKRCLIFYRYVKVYLLPDTKKGGKRKTKVKRNSLNPDFDDILEVSDTH